jgi:hypothetical protein
VIGLEHPLGKVGLVEGRSNVEVVSFFVEFEAAVPRLTPAFW